MCWDQGTVATLAQHKSQQATLTLKNARDGVGVPFYVVFYFPAQEQTLTQVMEEMLHFVSFIL